MLGRGENICTNPCDLTAFFVGHLRDAKVGDLQHTPVCRQQEIVGFDVAVNNFLTVRISQRLGHLLKVRQSLIKTDWLLAAKRPEIAAGHVFKHEVMKRHPFKISGGTMAQSQDYVRMPHPVQGNGFVLKVLYEGLFQVWVRRSLKRSV